MPFNWQELIQLHWSVLLGEALIIITLLHMLYRRRPATSMIAWLLAMLLLPYLFVLLYFLFGSRKRIYKKAKSPFVIEPSAKIERHKRGAIDRILLSNGLPPGSDGNQIYLFTDGVTAFESLMENIRQAKSQICFCTYQFKDDPTTRQILTALSQKAREGVEVRLLIDSLGSYPLYFWQFPLRELRKSGAQIRFFMPVLRMPLRNYINLRNHRKIYLFDNSHLLTGGMNLANDYMGDKPDPSRWADLLFYLHGSASSYYQQIFESDWSYASEQPLRKQGRCPSGAGDAHIQVIPSGPDIAGDPLFESLLSAIYSAKKRIWIVTPYFIPDESLIQALQIAHHQGVDVKLITPYQSDHLLADLARSSYMRQLEEREIDLVLYKGRMLHAKAILFDESCVMIGSVNLDNRSLFLNYEVVSFAYSQSIAKETEQWMLSLQNNAVRGMKPAGRVRTILENIMRMFAPQL